MDRKFSELENEDFSEPHFRSGLENNELPCHSEAFHLAKDTVWNLSRMKTACKFVHDSVADSFRSQGTVGGRSLRKCFDRSDRLITDTLQPLYSRYYTKTVGDGLTHHEACHVVCLQVAANSIKPRESVFQLHSMRILLTGKKVETECIPLPLAFRLHAVARFIERNEAATSVIRQIGMDLVGWAAMLRLAERTSVGELNDLMVLPAFGDGGMLCGHFKPDYALAEGFLTTVSVDGLVETAIPRDPLDTALFDASTYYGEAQRNNARDNVRRELVDWRARNAEPYAREMSDVLWPGRKLIPVREVDYLSPHAEELEGILTDQAIANTIAKRNWKVAPLRFQPQPHFGMV